MKILDKSLSKLVAKYELEEFELNGNTFSFFIEIYKNINTNQFSSKVYRKDFFLLKPSFDERVHKEFDEVLIVEDANF